MWPDFCIFCFEMLGQSDKIFFYGTNEFKAVINFSVGYFHLQTEKVIGIWVN